MLSTFLLSIILAATPKFITYEQFGAVGDGINDDAAAIYAAHESANRTGKTVKADGSKTYLIVDVKKPIRIQTDVEWGDAEFIIDDVNSSNPESRIFVVTSAEKKLKLSGIERLGKGAGNLGIKLPQRSVVEIIDNTHNIYRRKGSNATAGSTKRDYLVVNTDGSIRSDSPVIWDFDNISSVNAYPMDEKCLTIKGGHFTTKANVVNTNKYYNRNIVISRSNVRIVGLTHKIEGEAEVGAPYHGFLSVTCCADVILDSLVLSAHKTYYTIGKLGKPTAKGSYDMSLNKAIGVKVRNSSQFTDIDDKSKWGIMGSNFCKNITYENCTLSRFDAHQGVAGASISNCTIGQINAIGFGTFLIENSEIHSNNLVHIRGDYGSSWDGEFIIRNCSLNVPSGSKDVVLFRGYNTQDHDFGYDCTMPRKILISGLRIDDTSIKDSNYNGPMFFATFKKGKNAIEGYHYPATEEVILRGVSISSGNTITISDNREGFFDKTRFEIKPEVSWSLMHPTVLDTIYMKRVLEISKNHEMDSFEICGACGAFTDGSLDGLLYFEDYPNGSKEVNQEAVRHNRESIKAIVRMCHEAGKPVYYWHREVLCNPGILKDTPNLLNAEGEFDLLGTDYEKFLRYKIRKTFELVPDLDGIALTLTEASASTIHNSQPDLYPPHKVVEKIGRIFAEELSKRGKKLIIRSFGSIEQDYNSIDEGAGLLAKDFSFEIETKITPYDFSPFMPDNKFLKQVKGCTISAECDGLGEFLGAGRMPSECIEDIVRYVRYAKLRGVDRYTIRLDRHGKNIFDSYPINLYAYERAIANPDISADEIRRDYYGSIYKNRKICEIMCRMSKDGRDCALKSLFVNGTVLFHQFPTQASLHLIKAGGVLSLFSNSSSSLDAKSEQWGVATNLQIPGRVKLLEEKEEAVALAEKNLSLLKRYKSKLTSEDYARMDRLWNYALIEAKSNYELCKVISAYFDSIEDMDASGEKVRTANENLKKSLSCLSLNRPIIEIGDLIVSDYDIESNMRTNLKGSLDFVIPAGIFDDIRGERYMHGAVEEYLDGKVYLRIGNKIFPNAYYKTTLKGRGEKTKFLIDGKGFCAIAINGETKIIDLDSTQCIEAAAADSYEVIISKAEGHTYPLVASISIK